MSSFQCEVCKAAIIETERGYITGCPHHPLERMDVDRMDVARKEYPEKIVSRKHRTLTQWPPIGPEVIQKIVELYPTHSIRSLAETLHLKFNHLGFILKKMEKKGINIQKKKAEAKGSVVVAIKDYLSQRNEKPPEGGSR